MAKKQRKYDMEYKIQAVKLAKELGGAKAASELGIPENTIFPAKDGKLYVSAIFDCFDAAVLGLSMETNMKAELCERTLENAVQIGRAHV